MSIRPMTKTEIVKALRRAAAVCLEKGRICWDALDVCVADAAATTAYGQIVESDPIYAETPEHAAFFLLFVARQRAIEAVKAAP